MVTEYHTEFLTATILGWHHLLKDNSYKDVIIKSFEWLVNKNKCAINAFVIMPNHFHLIWKRSNGFERKNVQGSLFSFTAHEFKKKINNDPSLLENYYVNNADREFQFWEREPRLKNAGQKNSFSKN
ncbi:MAG: hypothetical protein ABI266_07365 [Ginsengibacter sp.]